MIRLFLRAMSLRSDPVFARAGAVCKGPCAQVSDPQHHPVDTVKSSPAPAPGSSS